MRIAASLQNISCLMYKMSSNYHNHKYVLVSVMPIKLMRYDLIQFNLFKEIIKKFEKLTKSEIF